MVSGGMVGLTGWHSTKYVAIPGKVKVWKESTEVRAFSKVPRWRWEFPTDTEFFDVLSNDKGEVFEARKAKRLESGWKHEVVFKDESARPKGYAGLNQSCASCHDTAATIHEVPGRIYLRVRWGDDGRFSWRPFNDNGTLDESWPLQKM